MNIKTVLSLAVTPTLLAAFAATPEAMAATYSDHAGTVCKNYNAGQATNIDYLTWGTRSNAAGSTAVICPVVRSTTNTAGATAYVDFVHNATGTTSCTLNSINITGAVLASNSNSYAGGVGPHTIVLSLGAGTSNYWSTYSVLCTIPGSYNGVLVDVDLVEN